MAVNDYLDQIIDLANRAKLEQENGINNIIKVKNGELIQSAIDKARGGDEIRIESGSYEGFILKKHADERYINIVSDTDTSDVNDLAVNIVSSITTELGAGYYNLTGLHCISPKEVATLIALGDLPTTSIDDVPHHIFVWACFLDGKGACKRGISVNGAYINITNNVFRGIKKVGQDSQCISCWNGPGPINIINNYLEGGSEVILFGGSDPTIPGLIPTDIRITSNILTRPIEWQTIKAITKNTLELKSIKNALINKNLIENCWTDGQAGFVIQFTVRNQSGNAKQSTIQNVELSYNVIRNAPQGINILGLDDISNFESVRMDGINIHDNLMYNIDKGSQVGRLIMINNGPTNVIIDSNTLLGKITSGLEFDPGKSKSLAQIRFENNIINEGNYGIKSTTVPIGLQSWNAHVTSDSVFNHNCIVKTNSARINYPGINEFVTSIENMSYKDYGVNIDDLRGFVKF